MHKKRRAKVWINNLFLHPTNNKSNIISITPDHKMLTLDGRNIIKKELKDLHESKECVFAVSKIPMINDKYSHLSPEIMYLSGSILSDGSIAYRNGKPIGVRFTQKSVPEKNDFIYRVTSSFKNEFDAEIKNYSTNKFNVSEFSSNKKLPAETFEEIKNNITDIMLFGSSEEISSFMAGYADGDGHLNKEKNWLELYVDSRKEKLIQSLVIGCLRLGIPFRISYKKSNCTGVVLLDCENLNSIISKCSRIKGWNSSRTEDYKLFSARQIIGDVRSSVDWRGNLWAYVKRDILMGIDKLVNYIINDELKEELKRFSESDLRMMRLEVLDDREDEVFNLTIDADDELNHNYIVFSSNYTPIVVGNCHASIVGREMGLPVVVGTKIATKTLKDGQIVTVDAYHGLIYSGEIKIEKPVEKEVLADVEIKTSLKVNLAFVLPNLEEIASKVDGVGLLRIEHMITQSGIHPAKLIREGRKEEYIKILLDGIRPIAQAFNPKPVWVRSMDARTDEFRNLQGGEDEPKEDNPMLGWHGIRRSLDEPELLKAEFEAVKKLHEEGLTNVHIMIPFIISVDELRKAREISQGILPETAKLGIMVETAAAAMLIEDFCKEGIAFASIGSNDLTQSVLCVDRNNASISSLYSEFHPAVLKMMGYVISICNKYNIESSICGESGSNPDMAKILVKLGIKSISCNMDAIDKVKQEIYKIEKE